MNSMRVGLQGWGSEGDNRPLIALAAALRQKGHQVRLVLTNVDGADYAPLCRMLDVPLEVVPETMGFSLPAVAADADSLDPMKLSRQMLEQALYPHLDAMYEAALDLCSRSDLVVWNYVAWYVKAAAQKTGVRDVAVHYVPGLVPSRLAPPEGLPDWGWFNPAWWFLARKLLDVGLRQPARFFRSRGLAAPRHVLPDLAFSDHLNLHAASPSLWPPPLDSGEIHQACGHFTLGDDSVPWEPSPALGAFLDSGERPVFCSLGSMEHMAPRRARALLVDGMREAGVRAIVQTKRAPLEERSEGDLYFLPWAPHRKLLPRCRAIIHHGGAGTSHAALRAGIPSVVLPFIFEQRLWGGRLHRTGTAPAPLSFWKATPEKFAEKLREVLTSESMATRARELSEQLAREDGVGTAARLLEQFYGESGR
jgi:UDP:flavonoid glycosyltransferase YjiC (YdhE family)